MHVINDTITCLSPHDGCVVTTEKTYDDVDVIILATGYKVTDCAPNFTVIGRDSTTTLSKSWAASKDLPLTLNGVVTPEYPNFFVQYGPSTNTIAGSITFFSECAANFVASLITLARREGGGGGGVIEVEKEACLHYCDEIRRAFVGRPEMDTCSAWYKPKVESSNDPGWSMPVTNYPGGMIGYWLRTRFLWRESDFIFGEDGGRGEDD
jgi:4-hydroxyacetophenone monooxygenase